METIVCLIISIWIFIEGIYMYLGKVGEAKTTLLNIIGTLENYDSGTLECFSEVDPVCHPKVAEILRREKLLIYFKTLLWLKK